MAATPPSPFVELFIPPISAVKDVRTTGQYHGPKICDGFLPSFSVQHFVIIIALPILATGGTASQEIRARKIRRLLEDLITVCKPRGRNSDCLTTSVALQLGTHGVVINQVMTDCQETG
jgi:hypothetical protein